MRRKGEHHQDDNSSRWLLTYADMITLLMAFFIMMYSMSVLNVGKFRQAAISIRSGFGGMVKGQGRSILGTSGMFAVRPSPIEGNTAGVPGQVVEQLVARIGEDSAAKDAVLFSEDERGLVITLLSDHLLFDPGSAELKPRAYPTLDRIAETLDKTLNEIGVEGHTCHLPPRGSRYPTNWELSTTRANNVLRYLVELKGLEGERFSASGYGSTRPIRANTSEANRRMNRRVEIVLLRPVGVPVTLAKDQPAGDDHVVPEIRRRSDQ